jgi:SAM-dependent methyltransferase
MFYDFFVDHYRNYQLTKVGSWRLSKYYQKIFHTLYTIQGPQALVLEIGPGIGRLAEECTATNYSYVGVEFNQGLVRELAPKFPIIRGLVPPLPIKNERIDVIVADQVLEHMPTFREALNLLAECHRGLKPSGFLVLGFPDYIRTGLVFYDIDYSHSFPTTENRVNQMLGDLGFHSLKVIRFSGPFSHPLLRLLIDLMIWGMNMRLTWLIAAALGVNGFQNRVHKTFGASTVIFAQKGAAPEEDSP